MPSNQKSRLTGQQEREPRKDKAQEKREAAAKRPVRQTIGTVTRVHGDGDTVGIEPDSK
ncbi:hypothetical protein SAMN03159463_05917 [Mesorhizobium sp. NFR06]|uniref:hypothetical protein n=1 Tax=Mesorhizobium sp. NFR06 TaxID=1566290 RepID=UPI0008E1CFF2|nr:hypothetical protein [Mesorhizobium sp. NFR06]SFQ18961.1 hypothetical protein SAMN03159463_05917 [Mesorhizobium sp. NFR06]